MSDIQNINRKSDEYVEILEKIKPIPTLGNTGLMTVQMVADYFEVNKNTIDVLISRNRKRLEKNGLLIMSGKKVKEKLMKQNENFTNFRGYFECLGQKFANRNNVLIDKKVLLEMAMLLTNSNISIKFKEITGLSLVNNIRKENNFIYKLEKALKPFNISGEKQYSILNYRIDYYIISLNIAIEYDENNHNCYSYESHEGRQKKIEKELGCKFIRISDKNSDEYNIGYVIKNMFDL